MCSSANIHEALIRAVRCCSNIKDFEREQYFLHWSLELQNDCALYAYYDSYLTIECFFTRFNNSELYFDRQNYDILRRRVREYDQKRKQTEIERRQREQKLETSYIAYPFQSKLFVQFQEDYRRFWLKCCNYNDEHTLNRFNIKFVRRPLYPSKTK